MTDYNPKLLPPVLATANATSSATAQRKPTVLIIGGYGCVGGYIASHLQKSDSDIHIIVAGRSLEKAKSAAHRYGNGANGIAIDAKNTASVDQAVKNAALVILNTEAGTDTVAKACIQNGAGMISVAASVSVLQGLAALQTDAKTNGVTLAKEVGLAPGLIEMLARHIVGDQTKLDLVEFFVELGLFGHHGQESTVWTLARVSEAQKTVKIPHLSDVSRVIPVDFIDKREIAEKLRSQRVESYFVPRPHWTAGWLVRLAPALQKHPNLVQRVSASLASILSFFSLSTDRFRLSVRATSLRGRSASSLRGQNQSKVTGILAAETALAILRGDAPLGVTNMRDILDFRSLRRQFDDWGLALEMSEGA